MPSVSYRRWRTTRANALDEIARAHAAVGGTGPGRRYATQQVNHAYAVLLASQFQGFCRDLHSECVDHLVRAIPAPLQPVVRAEFTRGRQLDRGNAQPGSIGADFGRLGVRFWDEVETFSPQNAERRDRLEELNNWRNAIAHQDFDPARLGAATTLRLAQVRRWRNACRGLARAFDEVMRRHVHALTGAAPW
jgi:hypothetical protein